MTGTAALPDERVTRCIAAARAALAARAGELDDLNVFPVADGDTGTNMLMTAAAVEEAARATAGMPSAERWDAIARAALMGARGNSGMILSQLVRGAAEAMAAATGPPGGAAVAEALRAASDAAYGAVRAPVEGTMLTVARAAAEAAADASGGGPLGALEAALAGARDAVAATTGMLPALREAGVVDAGGLGVAILLEGLAAALAGREPPAAPPAAAPRAPATDHPPSRFRYCTTFLVEGEAIDLPALEAALLPLGDSLLVMGDARRAKVHVHTDAPERAAAAAAAWGAVDGVRWDDMRRQEAERAARIARRAHPAARCAALAVAGGDGLRALTEGLGATPLAPAGDPAPIAAAIGALDGLEVVVLACGADAADAREAAEGHPGVEVVAVSGPPAMLSALVELDPAASAAEAAERMRAAAGAVAVAAVDGDDPGALREALARALAPLVAPGGDALVTVLVGAAPAVDPAVVEGWVRAAAGAGVEVEAHAGGQAAPALWVGVE
ncbi:DAK2 domain-containing protein [Miltoncostaea marina]|uniref:DAK2 domain-containing protein n=1 Tax=Miltoncostaea marina TaxID=2843215 RepID=UPI001C3D916D|nr:DAK2 domain-containing protein [Miltoncostaea marina]